MGETRVKADLEVMALAERISTVLEGYRGRIVTPETVDLRMVADLCWALDVTPQFVLTPRPAPAKDEAQ